MRNESVMKPQLTNRLITRQLSSRSLLTSLVLVSLLGLLPLSLHAAEADGAKLAQSLKCYACHTLDEPLIGPPYKAIAARHKADKELMVDVLARKIVSGGGGNWGVVPMVPNEHVSEADALALARWVLGQ
jgi:cytochrome c